MTESARLFVRPLNPTEVSSMGVMEPTEAKLAVLVRLRR